MFQIKERLSTLFSNPSAHVPIHEDNEDNIYENRGYYGSSGMGEVKTALSHIQNHPCVYVHAQHINGLPNALILNQYNLDPLSYKIEWQVDTIQIISLIIKEYLRSNIPEKRLIELCYKHNSMFDLLKEIEHSSYFKAKGTEISEDTWKMLFMFKFQPKLEKDLDVQYNYTPEFTRQSLLSQSGNRAVSFLTQLALLSYRLMNHQALAIIDHVDYHYTEMLPNDPHIKQWIITHDFDLIKGMNTLYLFNSHCIVDVSHYMIEKECLRKENRIQSNMTLDEKIRYLNIGEYIKVKCVPS